MLLLVGRGTQVSTLKGGQENFQAKEEEKEKGQQEQKDRSMMVGLAKAAHLFSIPETKSEESGRRTALARNSIFTSCITLFCRSLE